MEHIVKKNWITGSGNNIDFYDLLKLVRQYITEGSKIFIGTDSFISGNKISFASAICLHGGIQGGRYFFYKEFTSKLKFSQLASRITEETRRSVDIACLFMNEYNIDAQKIELHLDVSPFGANNGTSKYSDMLKGYVQGFGVEYRLKPDAWASQTIADKHSK